MNIADVSPSDVRLSYQASAARSPRVYSLDMACGGFSDPPFVHVLDINGARTSFGAQEALYGDRRVESNMLKVLAEAGDGEIDSISHEALPAFASKYSYDALRQMASSEIGLSWAHTAYVPVGSPTDLSGEDRTAELAQELGISYRRWHVSWSTKECRFMIRSLSPEQREYSFKDWRPKGVLWPYSWDQRIMPLPLEAAICNPLPYYLFATNKLLSARVCRTLRGESWSAPPSASVGLIRSGSDVVSRFEEVLGTAPLVVIKPNSGRRSYGVLVAPRADLRKVLALIGVEASREKGLALGARVVAHALLWGTGAQSISLLQPYVMPELRLCERSGRHHAAFLRAVVVAEPGRDPRCIDVCRVLCGEPRDRSAGAMGRESYIVAGSNVTFQALSNNEYDNASAIAEACVMKLEAGADLISADRAQDVLRREIEITIAAIDEWADVSVREAWERIENERLLYDHIKELILDN